MADNKGIELRELAADALRWLDDRLVMASNGIGRVLPRTDAHEFREMANELWWLRVMEIRPEFPPADLDSGFEAFEAALGWQNVNA
ncbi:MAG: hypothetical protein EXS05_04400, partial [Planctomycetaceae bacterium]|nr:hypothetical protein [Planctomycetaceae bacterium]